MPQLKNTARPQYTQNSLPIVSRSQDPASGFSAPYSVTVINIVPTLISQAGMNRLSVGWRIDDMKVDGWNLNLKDMITTFIMKRAMLKRKKMQPMVYRPRKSQGTKVVKLVSLGL